MNGTLYVKRSVLSLGLIGYPLSHSLSPQIHNAALQALGLNGEYRLYPIPNPPSPQRMPEAAEGEGADINALEELLSQMCAGVIHGLNVTIPHKQTVIPLLDELTPAAKTIGAVNTIFRDGDLLVGDNTDAPGFWTDVQRLAESGERRANNHALILGAGGSARAVAYALLTNGYSVTIAARRIEQARALSDQFSVNGKQSSVVSLNNWSLITDHHLLPTDNHEASLKRGWSLVINTTPVGMHPHVDNSPWPEGVPFPKNAAVYDLVYNPRETLLVKQARAAGLPATTGLGMLVEQAALAFERWTGLEAPRDVMMEAAEGKQ